MATITGILGQILKTDISPRIGAGTPSPIGTVAISATPAGVMFTKIGAADIDWERVSLFGSDADFAEYLAETTTTSTTYVVKVTLVTAILVAGNYWIAFTSAQGSDKANTNVSYRLAVDGVQIIDSNRTPGTTTLESIGSGYVVVPLSAAAHTITLDHKTDPGAGVGSRMRDARIAIWRID